MASSADLTDAVPEVATAKRRARHRPLTRLQKIDTSRLSDRVRPRLKPRGLPPALADHLIWHTDEPHEAEQFGRDLFGAHTLTVEDPSPHEFEASFHAVRLRDLTIGYLDYTCAVRVHAPQLPSAFLVMVPMSGEVTVATTSDVGPPVAMVQANPITAALPRHSRPMVAHCKRQSPLLLVLIDAPALRRHLSRLLGRPLHERLEFEAEFRLGEPRASRWNFAIQMLHAELFEAGSLLNSGIGIGQLEEFVMSSLLYAHASNYSSFLTRPGEATEHRAIRAAKEYIEEHLAEPITVGDIALAAGVSERTLQSAFRHDLSTTPVAYVRDRRLERARADLADAAPGEASVTAIATRWGFGHLGRFASEYKARFGESPSQTLRA